MDQPSRPRKRGYSVFAFLVVMIVIVIAVVAAQTTRQQRGDALWYGTGLTPAGMMPKCLMPGSSAKVKGTVNIYPDISGFPCYTLEVPNETSAAGVVATLAQKQGEIRAACGQENANWRYDGRGTYSCAGQPEGYVSHAAGLMPFAGASHKISDLLRHTPSCGPGRAPTIVSGTIAMYASASARRPCATTKITAPVVASPENLAQIERGLASSCGLGSGWYVVDAQCACPRREGFFCWGGESSRENCCGAFRSSGSCGSCAAKREGFRPDCPGACSGEEYGWAQNDRAAQYELQALKVLSGTV